MHPESDADARFDRTVERWFRDMLALDPEEATYLGVHEHDHQLADGTREQVEQQAAFHRAAIAEMERFSVDDLTAERALDRDLVMHEARLAAHQLTERRDWAGSSGAAASIGLGRSKGRLRPGYDADVLVVGGDLAADLTALWHVRQVMLRGVPVPPRSRQS